MKTKLMLMIFAALLFSFALQAQGGWKDYRRGNCQKECIRQGWRSGEITAYELKHLRKEHRRIHRAKMHMLRDGKLDARDRHRLHRMNQHFNREIWKEKHDCQKRRFR